MNNMEDVAKKLCESKSIPECRKIYKAMGIDYVVPSIHSQILHKGTVEKRHRGKAKDDSEFIVIPEVHLATGRVLPELMVDPRTARTAALEVLRICDERNW